MASLAESCVGGSSQGDALLAENFNQPTQLPAGPIAWRTVDTGLQAPSSVNVPNYTNGGCRFPDLPPDLLCHWGVHEPDGHMQQDTAVQIFAMPGIVPADAVFQLTERIGDGWANDLIWAGANPGTLTVSADSGVQPVADFAGYEAWKRSALLRMRIERTIRIDGNSTATVRGEPSVKGTVVVVALGDDLYLTYSRSAQSLDPASERTVIDDVSQILSPPTPRD